MGRPPIEEEVRRVNWEGQEAKEVVRRVYSEREEVR